MNWLLLGQNAPETNSWTLLFVAAFSAAMGMALFKLLGYLRKRDAEKMAQLILEKAEMQAESRRKEAEVQAKELAFQEKSRIEEQMNEVRQKLHDRERQLEK